MSRCQLNEVKKQVERERLLKNIINSIRSSLDINEVKNTIVNEVASAFNADRCFIRIFQTKADNLLSVDNHSEYLRFTDDGFLANYVFDEKYNQIENLHYKSNQGFIINDIDVLTKDLSSDNVVVKTVSEDFKAKSSYSFPIVKDDEFIGAFAVQYTKRKVSLNNGEIELLKAIASQAAIAIKQAEMFSSINQKAKREELLRRITQNIRQSLDLSEVLDNICSELFNLFNVDKVALSKYSETEDNIPSWTFLVEYQKKDLPMLASINPTYNTSSYFAKQIFDESENIIIDNIDDSNYPDYLVNIYKNLNKAIIKMAAIR